MNINQVIKRPILTEKTYAQMQNGVYTFAVDRRSHKIEIKKAVEYIFDVKVISVNVFNVPKKPKKLGKFAGFTSSYKKAIVTLDKGSAIQLFEDETLATAQESESEVKKEIKVKKETQAEEKAAAKIAAATEKANEKTSSKDEEVQVQELAEENK